MDYPQIKDNQQTRNFQEEEIHLRDYWRVLVKYRWTIAAVFIIVTTIKAINIFKMTSIYKATAQIQIEKPPHIVSIKEVASDTRMWNYFQTQHKILQSRSMAKAVVKTSDLANCKELKGNKKRKKNIFHTIKHSLSLFLKNSLQKAMSFLVPNTNQSKAQPPTALTPKERKAKQEDELIGIVRDGLQIDIVEGSNLMNISYLSPYPGMTAKIANAVAEQYIQRNMQLKYETTREATEWLNQHVGELKKKLESSEEALHSYKERERIVSMEEKQNIIVQKLSELNSAVTEAKTKKIGLEIRYNLSKRFKRIEDLEFLPTVMQNPLIQKLKTEYISFSIEYTRESLKYGPKHPHMIKIDTQLENIKKRIDSEVKKTVSSIKTKYEIALAQEKVLSEALEVQRKEAFELNRKAIKYSVLKQDAESNRKIFEVVLNRLKETDLTLGLKNSNVRIIDKAQVPQSPVKPNKKRKIMMAALLGLFLGTGLAFFLEYLDNTVKTPEELKRYCGLPFLGPIPHFNFSEQKGVSSPELIALHKPKSHPSEAYRGLRTSILFSFPDSSAKSLLITSAHPSEGKTITTLNLAVTMAQSGAKVVIIEGDMRKPCLHRLLHLKNDRGLSNLLIGQRSLEEVLQEGPTPNLSIIPCGHCPPNPSELLAAPSMKKMLHQLKTHYDLILIDSPPIVAVTDAVIISRLVDGAALVIHGGVTSKDIIKRGCDLLQKANANLLGAVINNIDLAKRSYYYYYQYYYYQSYGDEPKPCKPRKRKNSLPSDSNKA